LRAVVVRFDVFRVVVFRVVALAAGLRVVALCTAFVLLVDVLLRAGAFLRVEGFLGARLAGLWLSAAIDRLIPLDPGAQ
jgi:hypothetical protein